MQEKLFKLFNTHRMFFIFLICLLFGGITGYSFMIINHWDLLSYHYYNGWAFFNNRLDIDIMPSMFRSYFNPLSDAILFLLIEKLNTHPLLFSFISGTKYGIFIFLSYFLYDKVMLNKSSEKTALILASLILLIFSPIVLVLTDFFTNDIQLNILIFIAFLIFLNNIYKSTSFKRTLLFLLAGILMGAATGLKYAMCVFCFGIFLCILINYKKIQNPVKIMFSLFAGMFLGFLITNGWWMWVLWKHFQNPLFPYFNNIFKSSFCDINTVYGNEFAHLRPDNIIAFLFAPLQNTIKGFRGLEVGFFDLKIPLAFVSCIGYYILQKKEIFKDKINKIVDVNAFNLIILFTASIYYINLFLFGNLRYIAILFALISFIIVTFCFALNTYQKTSDTKINLLNFVLLIVFCFYNMKINYLEIFEIIGYFVLLVIILLIAKIYLTTSDKVYQIEKRQLISLILLCIFSISSFRFMFRSSSTPAWGDIVKIKNVKFPDNSNVICGTMLAGFIVPKQNPNARYVGFSMPKHLLSKAYWLSKTKYKNMYFSDGVLEEKISKMFEDNKPLYFVYVESQLGPKKNDFNLYEEALSYYSKNEYHFKNCKSVPYSIMNIDEPLEEIVVCKIK